MRLAGVGAALAMAAQIAYLTWPSTQGLVAAALASLLIWQLWLIRRHLNQHVDMLVLMTAYGGFGMLLERQQGGDCHRRCGAATDRFQHQR